MNDTDKETDKVKDLLKEIYESDLGLKAYIMGFYTGIILSLIILFTLTIIQLFKLMR